LVSYSTKGEAAAFRHPGALGKARVAREGGDLTIVSYSRVALEALQAADLLAAEGISAELIDLRTISPWDKEAVLKSVAKTGRLHLHTTVRPFGAGAEIAATVSEELFGKLKAPVRRSGRAFLPVPFSSALESAFAVIAMTSFRSRDPSCNQRRRGCWSCHEHRHFAPQAGFLDERRTGG